MKQLYGHQHHHHCRYHLFLLFVTIDRCDCCCKQRLKAQQGYGDIHLARGGLSYPCPFPFPLTLSLTLPVLPLLPSLPFISPSHLLNPSVTPPPPPSPPPPPLAFYASTQGDAATAGYHELFQEAVKRLEKQGGRQVDINFSPFAAAAKLLYESAFVAERYSGIRSFLEKDHVSLASVLLFHLPSPVFCVRNPLLLQCV